MFTCELLPGVLYCPCCNHCRCTSMHISHLIHCSLCYTGCRRDLLQRTGLALTASRPWTPTVNESSNTVCLQEFTPVANDGLRRCLGMLRGTAGHHGRLRLDWEHAGAEHAAAVCAFHGICHSEAGLHIHQQRHIRACEFSITCLLASNRPRKTLEILASTASTAQGQPS